MPEKASSDFMIQEYDQIATAYFSLGSRIDAMIRAYLVVFGLPLTLLAAVLKFDDESVMITLGELPDLVSGLLIVVSFLGGIITLTIVSMRLEQIMYARAINCVRRYFAVWDEIGAQSRQRIPLWQHLVLPTSDVQPPFYERWRTMFWQILMFGILDGVILGLAVYNLMEILPFYAVMSGAIYTALHMFLYWLLAKARERRWTRRFQNDLVASNS